MHRAMGHPVAIRLLRRMANGTGKGRVRVPREAQTLQVAHPSIIQVRDYGEEPGLVLLVTDFIEGPSLRELMQASRRRRGRGCAARARRSRPSAPARPALRRQSDIIRIDGRRSERLMISSAGVWRAADLLATLQERTLRGIQARCGAPLRRRS